MTTDPPAASDRQHRPTQENPHETNPGLDRRRTGCWPVAAAAQARPPGSPASGAPNDEIGAANYLTPAVALEAAKLVKTGKTYSLGITVNTTTPAFPPRTCSIYIVQPGQAGRSEGLGPTKTTYNDDILNCWTGIGTQLDGLGHIGVADRYYNGNKWAEFATIGGLKKLGADKRAADGHARRAAGHGGLPGRRRGQGRHRLQQGRDRGRRQKQGVEIRQGDVVIFHTGWLSLIDKDPKRFGSVEPGPGPRRRALPGVARAWSPSAPTPGALEAIPFEKDAGVFEVHQILLPMSGTYILENVNTAELAKDKAYEFLFVLGQNKYQGSVQSMINPVAIR